MKIREAEHEEGGRIAGFWLLGRFMPPAAPEIEGKRHFLVIISFQIISFLLKNRALYIIIKV